MLVIIPMIVISSETIASVDTNKVSKSDSLIPVCSLLLSDTGSVIITCGGIPSDDPAACNGHGTCEEGTGLPEGTGICNCEVGYTGDTCEQQELVCNGVGASDSMVCGGKGQCIEGVGDGNSKVGCRCDDGWLGYECDYKPERKCFGTLASLDTVCSSHGECVAEDRCECEPGWSGTVCQSHVGVSCGPAGGEPCNGNGVCSHDDSCECFEGYSGEYCQDQFTGTCFGIAYDDPRVCLGLGKCIGPDECHCNDRSGGLGSIDCSFEGWECGPGLGYVYETDSGSSWDIIGSSGCVHGKCASKDNCVCEPGYVGEFCELEDGPWDTCGGIQMGDPDVCNGRGTCAINIIEDPDGGVWRHTYCACQFGFYGEFCESVFTCGSYDIFSAHVCSGPEQGQCMPDQANPGATACWCEDGYSGTNCEIQE